MPPLKGDTPGAGTGKYARLVQEAMHGAPSSASEKQRFERRTADCTARDTPSISHAPREGAAADATRSPTTNGVPDREAEVVVTVVEQEMSIKDKKDVAVYADEEGVEEEDEEDEEDGEVDAQLRHDVNEDDEDDAALDDGISKHQRQPQQLFSCDVCPHLLFATRADLVAHAQKHHHNLFPDYSTLHDIARKLAPHWSSLKTRKRDVIAAWGEKIFHVATTRDAGPAKMAEAHRAREQLELVARRWRPAAKVYMFGSAVSFAVWDGMSDIDFAVVDVAMFEAGTWPPPEKNAVRSTTELLRRAGFSFANIEPISHARVPIIKHHASAPIRLASRPVTWRPSPAQAAPSSSSSSSQNERPAAEAERLEAEAQSVLEAEDVVARSVRFLLNQPATRQDRVVLEGSVRHAVERGHGSLPPLTATSSLSAGATAAATLGSVQQVWWNRTADVMSVTCDSTTSAMRASTAMLCFASPALRAKVQPLHDECRPELFNVDFDLSFRAFGIRNSLLLRRYLTSHPCARPGAIVLKDWSKTSGVNNSVNGYLTSYAINIMWIYFLVQRGVVPYVDPISDIPASLRPQPGVPQDPYLRDGFPEYIPFIPSELTDKGDGSLRDGQDGKASTAPSDALKALHAEAGELLLGFFHFYAFEFDWERHVVSLNRKGITTKKMLGWDREDVTASSAGGAAAGAGNNGGGKGGGGAAGGRPRGHAVTRYAFCIEDPYEMNLNLGRHMGITKYLKVKAEFYRAFLSLLKDGSSQSCVFTATDAAERRRAKSGATSSTATSAAAVASPQEVVPDRLPLRVLYRLTAAALQTLSDYTVRQANTTSTGAAVESADPVGIPAQALEAALRRRCPAELALALKVWNWQQLVHRLGLKELHGVVYPRREVGARRLAARVDEAVVAAPAVLKATAASAEAEKTHQSSLPTARAEETTRTALGAVASRGLAETLILALTTPRGYLALTPEWVAWSTPWATLKTRVLGREIEQANHNHNHNNSNKRKNGGSTEGASTAGTNAGLFATTRPHGMAPRVTSAWDAPSLPTVLKRVWRK